MSAVYGVSREMAVVVRLAGVAVIGAHIPGVVSYDPALRWGAGGLVCKDAKELWSVRADYVQAYAGGQFSLYVNGAASEVFDMNSTDGFLESYVVLSSGDVLDVRPTGSDTVADFECQLVLRRVA